MPVAHQVMPAEALCNKDVVQLAGKSRLGVPRDITPRDIANEIDGRGWRDCRDFDGTGDSTDGWYDIGNKTNASCLVDKIGNLFLSFAGHQSFSDVEWGGFCSMPDIGKMRTLFVHAIPVRHATAFLDSRVTDEHSKAVSDFA